MNIFKDRKNKFLIIEGIFIGFLIFLMFLVLLLIVGSSVYHHNNTDYRDRYFLMNEHRVIGPSNINTILEEYSLIGERSEEVPTVSPH